MYIMDVVLTRWNLIQIYTTHHSNFTTRVEMALIILLIQYCVIFLNYSYLLLGFEVNDRLYGACSCCAPVHDEHTLRV